MYARKKNSDNPENLSPYEKWQRNEDIKANGEAPISFVSNPIKNPASFSTKSKGLDKYTNEVMSQKNHHYHSEQERATGRESTMSTRTSGGIHNHYEDNQSMAQKLANSTHNPML